MIDLGERSGDAELMDLEDSDLATFDACLRDRRMNRLVRHDVATSVARAFVRRDWERLLDEAGLEGRPTTVSWCFPFRYAVGRIRAT